jgi:DUF1365 family protein
MVYLDLDELETVFECSRIWSTSGWALARFRRSDHLGYPETPLDHAVRDLVLKECGFSARGPIRLLTHLSYFGYRFNPVSFYFCFDESDTEVTAVVAEINNTPWGEQFCYVLDKRHNLGNSHKLCYRFPKNFHVSPFMSMDHEYRWYFTTPGKGLNIHMENIEAKGGKVFDATLVLRKKDISAGRLRMLLIRYPFLTLKVIGAIYWNALLLRLKGCRIFPHPRHLSQEASQR